MDREKGKAQAMATYTAAMKAAPSPLKPVPSKAEYDRLKAEIQGGITVLIIFGNETDLAAKRKMFGELEALAGKYPQVTFLKIDTSIAEMEELYHQCWMEESLPFYRVIEKDTWRGAYKSISQLGDRLSHFFGGPGPSTI